LSAASATQSFFKESTHENHIHDESDKWIDTVMAFEKLADEQDQTTLDLDGVLVTLGAEHFDEIRIAY
jgi:hypothetical protein